MFQNKILTVLILCLIPFFGSCRCSKEKTPPKNFRPTVSADGVKLSFHPESPGLKQIGTVEFGSKSEFVSVLAPARIIATISTSVSGGKIVLFETPEINAQYASYIASKNTRIRASKNLARIRDMYKNQVATEKDIIEAEADANNAQAQFAEFEGKLRALGFNT
ncbi:MAG: hypothetical protein K8R21_15315 [Leptospira sp.]|nr:hypothetical protein [Leptospira sp.]